jgi:hypothetical protein
MIWSNLNKIILIFLLSLACFYFLGSSGGVSTFQREDRTGSPLSLNSTCGTCHYGGNFQSKLVLTVLKDSIPVKAYLPNTDYLIYVSIPSIIPAKVHGLQLVAFQSGNNQQAGTFGTLTSNLRAVELWNRIYIEQSRPQQSHSFFIPWKSPSKDIGPVNFYAAGLAANENNTTTGDSPVRLEVPFVLPPETITQLADFQEKEKLSIISQAGEMTVILENFKSGDFLLKIYDYSGKLIQQKKIVIRDKRVSVNLNTFIQGFYIVSIMNGTTSISSSFYQP